MSGIWRGADATTLLSSARLERLKRCRPTDVGPAFGKFSAGSKDLGAVAPGMTGQFYQRMLPAEQIAFASHVGRGMFREALAAGTMENYFFLAEQFRTQDEPTFCGLATLAMVLNALRIDPMRTWKGAWRWFNEQNLGCCADVNKVREQGLSYDMFEQLASCNGARTTARRAPVAKSTRSRQSFVDEFRATVRATSRSWERECVVVCYSREALGQSGAGHFSPIGGYHEESDMVLIMDVASFKYPPHWASLEAVVEGMFQLDSQTGRPRGYLQLRAPCEVDAPPDLQLNPLHMLLLPKAAGHHLAESLASALAEVAEAPAAGHIENADVSLPPLPEADAASAMQRWLHAASVAEPQVLGKLLQAGDEAALEDLLRCLYQVPTFVVLCRAYEELRRRGGPGCAFSGLCMIREFPPLRFSRELLASVLQPSGSLSLDTCGELWVLLLMLLPEGLRSLAAPGLVGHSIAHALSKAVRGPWPLPLEALRESMALQLPLPAPTSRDACESTSDSALV